MATLTVLMPAMLAFLCMAVIVLLALVWQSRHLTVQQAERDSERLRVMTERQQQTLQALAVSESQQQQLTTQVQALQQQLQQQGSNQTHQLFQQFSEQKAELVTLLNEHKALFNQNQLDGLSRLTQHLSDTTQANREELAKNLQQNTQTLAEQIKGLTQSTDERLQQISGQVEKRLVEGLEKTNQTFSDILKRLALIDDAQKKITELSGNVVSLQEVLADKRSRGAFGEVQLSALVRNVLPEQHFAFQHTLSNGRIADCVLFLPEPTGNVVIDSKFPLENFRRMTDEQAAELDRKQAERQFKQDVKKHINDIADKYLIAGETADGALMFIPAEAIFAEIHAHHGDLLDVAYKRRVWLASPTTLMAILTTSRSVLKDEATRKQIHIIQEHLGKLGADFGRFRQRFDHLARHIDQAATDVKQIHTSAQKITNRFEQIEQVDLAAEGLNDRITAPDSAIAPELTTTSELPFERN